MRELAVFVLAGILAISGGPVSAQSFEIGVVAGLNSSGVSTDDPEFSDTQRRSAYIGGAFISVGLLDYLSIRPEVVYSQKGVSVIEAPFQFDINVDYIEVPLLVKLTTPRPVGFIRPHLLAGPALSFQSACWIYDSEDDDDYDCDELDVNVEAQDFGLVVGAGVDAELGRAVASIGGRYTIGTRTVDADPDPIDINNRVWSLTLSIAVRLVDL